MATERRIALGFAPRPHQIDAHRKRKRFSVFVWHRRAGKTWFSLGEAGVDGSRKPGSKFAYIAPLRNQAKSIAWDVLKTIFRPMLDLCSVNEGELTLTLPNGSSIRLFGADNPDALRGLAFDGVIMDEVAQMKSDLWGEVVRPALADRQGWAIFIGTPKGINTFSEVYQQALRDPEWYGEVRRATETNAIKEDELASMRREMNPSEWAQEMECDFNAGVENALLSMEQVLDAQKRTVKQEEFYFAPKVMGVDVARYGDDRSVIVVRQGVMMMRPQTYSQIDLMTLAGHVSREIESQRPDAIFIDNGGVGGGVIDRLRQLGHSIIAIDFGGSPLDQRYLNRRAEMWATMADWVKAGGCLPPEQSLMSDLTAPTFSFANASGRMALESKDKMKARGLRSPDLGDALALTFAAPVAAQVIESRWSAASTDRSANVSDYDPFKEVR